MFNIKEFRWSLVFLWASLTVIGLVAIYSATQGPVSQFLPASIQQNFDKQVVFVAISIALLFIVQFISPRFFEDGAYLFYGVTLILMIFTLFFGVEVNGARSWLRIGGINFQMSELMKVTTLLAAANYLTSQRNVSASNLRHSLTVTALFIIPIGLLLLQNDTGTALIFVGVLPFMLYWSGLPNTLTLLIVLAVLVGYMSLFNITAGLVTLFLFLILFFFLQREKRMVWIGLIIGIIVIIAVEVGMEHVLRPHQKARIEAFINPESDPQGAGWNVLQAKTAIGSGGITGKGFMQGTQTQLRFLPEQWTDFIFCVIGEEFGFLGSGMVITLFFLLFLNLVSMATSHNHPFAQLVMIGILSVFFIHFLINIGSAMGLLPVIGIPLPFVSYGGSSFLVNSLLIGIVLNLNLYERSFSIYR